MSDDKDYLDDLIAEETAANPNFPHLLEAAARARQLLHELAEARARAGLTQAEVARRMQSSETEVDDLETCGIDPYLSTLMDYAVAVGVRLVVQPG